MKLSMVNFVCLTSTLFLHSVSTLSVRADEPRDVGGKPPKNAVVLFDGTNLDSWSHNDGRTASWILSDGAMVVKPNSGNLYTKQKFEDFKLHVEFCLADLPKAVGQSKSNSGVKIYGIYEIQILDSVNNPTYFGGGCGSIYQQKNPDKNVCRKPGEWQSYDITFHRANFDDQKKVVSHPRVTVIWNGVKVHNDVEVLGVTGGSKPGPHPFLTSGPVMLQDHYTPVKFRNIWIVPLSKDVKSPDSFDPK